MIIRSAQLEPFRAIARSQFEAEMVEHLSTFAPELARVAGRPALAAAVHDGVTRAEGYGFTNRGPAQFFLEMMCALGFGFDTDPQYPWAAVVLADTRGDDQMQRASELFKRMNAYFDAVAGPENLHARMALGAAQRANGLLALPQGGGALEEAILAGFRSGYPQKCDAVGEAGLRALIAEAVGEADAHQLQSDGGRALVAATLFGFGHAALKDPLYPWIGGALRDSNVPNVEDRAERLRSRLRVYVDHMLRGLGGAGA